MIEMNQLSNLRSARDEYTRLGFDTLPLKPGTKEPIHRSWHKQEPSVMWRRAPENSNLGIRCAGPSGVAIIDCDEEILQGLSITYVGIYKALDSDLANILSLKQPL